jgi:hypothetical protein
MKRLEASIPNEQRRGDRCARVRRAAPWTGEFGRHGDRRNGALVLALMTAAVFSAGARRSSAQIYTRTNERGVVEATDVPERPGDYKLAYPKRLGVVIHSPGFRLRPSSHSAFNDHIAEAAGLHGVDIGLVRAVIQTESQFDDRAVSSVGAQGLMQLMPATARRFGVLDAFDPRQNILGGVRYLRLLLDMFRGDVVLATAAYNAGENAVLRYRGVPPYRETIGYVRKIQALLAGRALQPAVTTAALNPGATLASAATPGSALPSTGAAATRPRAAATPKPKPRTFYRWTDDKGVPHMSDSPPAGGARYVAFKSGD